MGGFGRLDWIWLCLLVAYVGWLIVVWLVLMWLFSACCVLAYVFDCWLTCGEACVVAV